MERYLAHRIIWRGKEYKMSVVTLCRLSDGTVEVSVKPFEGETAATSFHSGTITVTDDAFPHLIFS